MTLMLHAGANVIEPNYRLEGVDQSLGEFFVEAESAAAQAVSVVQQRSVAVGVDHGDVFRAWRQDKTDTARARHEDDGGGGPTPRGYGAGLEPVARSPRSGGFSMTA